MRIAFVFVCFWLISCDDQPKNPLLIQDGVWVESIAMTDTIEFTSNSTLSLKRGTELINGHILPKSGSGQYNYEIVGNEISLKWFLSSHSESSKYYFKQTNDMIEIGDFYKANLGVNILSFRKLD